MKNCQICGDPSFVPVCTKDHTEYVKCSHCHNTRQYPYPSELTSLAYYENYKSIKSSINNYLDDSSFNIYKNSKMMTFSDLGLDPSSFIEKRICDVGCATGQFIQLINEITDNRALTCGVDISDECIEIAKKNNLNCRKQDFFSVNEKFDLISMFHVLEHLHYPQKYIEHATRCLDTNGLLLIEIPVTGIVSEVFDSQWRYYIPNEHINLFSSKTILNLVENYKFKTIVTTSFGSGIDSNGGNKNEKSAMDKIAKKMGWGDTFVALFSKI